MLPRGPGGSSRTRTPPSTVSADSKWSQFVAASHRGGLRNAPGTQLMEGEIGLVAPDLPPTVYGTVTTWIAAGIWNEVWDVLAVHFDTFEAGGFRAHAVGPLPVPFTPIPLGTPPPAGYRRAHLQFTYESIPTNPVDPPAGTGLTHFTVFNGQRDGAPAVQTGRLLRLTGPGNFRQDHWVLLDDYTPPDAQWDVWVEPDTNPDTNTQTLSQMLNSAPANANYVRVSYDWSP